MLGTHRRPSDLPGISSAGAFDFALLTVNCLFGSPGRLLQCWQMFHPQLIIHLLLFLAEDGDSGSVKEEFDETDTSDGEVCFLCGTTFQPKQASTPVWFMSLVQGASRGVSVLPTRQTGKGPCGL